MKAILTGFEVFLGLGLLVLVYSQLILPMFRSTPVFPMFRARPKIMKQIEEVNEQLDDKELARQLKERERQLGKKQ
jgi:hypothetical protein